jgi:ParB-like chromosome segregation protein Spo0J
VVGGHGPGTKDGFNQQPSSTEIAKPKQGGDSELRFHPLADIFPLMEGAEFDELVEDIKKNGLQQYIILYDGQVLDGRNRVRACLAAGWDPFAIREMCLNGDNWIDDPAAYVISVNIRRRHLNAEDRQKFLIQVIAAAPEKSDRQHGKDLGVDHKTIARARAEGEDVGSIPHVDMRTDTKGRKQPAKKGWSRERYKQHRAKRRGLQNERDAATKERLRRENYFEETEAEAKRLAAKLVVLDPDLARDFHELLGIGGELQLMDALRDALGPEGAGRLEVSDDGLDISEYPRRAARDGAS